MRHDERPHARLALARDVEERRAARAAQPLVAVADKVVRRERAEVERQHAQRVRAVDQHRHAPVFGVRVCACVRVCLMAAVVHGASQLAA